MKGKIIIIPIICFLIIMINIRVYAESDIEIVLYTFKDSGGGGIATIADTDEYKNEALPLLKNTFGLEGNTIEERYRYNEI